MTGALSIGDGGISQGDKALGTSPASTKTDKMFASGFGALKPFARGEVVPSAPLPSMPSRTLGNQGLGAKSLSEFFNFKGEDKKLASQLKANDIQI